VLYWSPQCEEVEGDQNINEKLILSPLWKVKVSKARKTEYCEN
jgi:hypothetical protein